MGGKPVLSTAPDIREQEQYIEKLAELNYEAAVAEMDILLVRKHSLPSTPLQREQCNALYLRKNLLRQEVKTFSRYCIG